MLDVAITSWLPQAASNQNEERRNALEALNSLAGILADTHGDLWLKDLLQSFNPATGKGLVELSHAMKTNLAGNPTEALQGARQAQALMTVRQNRPGWLRAGLEVMYAFQRRSDSKGCVAQGSSLQRELGGRAYRWVEAQLALEQSICLNMAGEFALGYQALQHAIAASKNYQYRVLWLRTVGIEASFYTDIRSIEKAWSEDQGGLDQYWEGGYPEQRAFQFYADLANGAQKQDQLYVAAAFQREAALAISDTSNRSVAAMAWHRYAALAQMAGITSEARAGFQRANQLFSELPQDPTTRIYWEDSQLNFAALEADHGDFESSAKILNSLRNHLPEIANVTIQKRFYETEGTSLAQKGDYLEAEQSLQRALHLANAGFGKLKSDAERFAWEQETKKIYRGLVELRFRWQHDTDSALRLWRLYRASAWPTHNRRRPFPGTPLPAQNSAAQIAPGQMVLTYAQLPDGIALWLTNNLGTTAKWVDIKAFALQQLVDRFAEDCSDRTTAPAILQRDGHELYSLLIEPVVNQFTRTGLLIVETDGLLDRVPIQALPNRDGSFLGRDYPIVISEGSVDAVWRPLTITAQEHALVVGDPVLAPELTSDYPPLHSALEEAQFVSKLFSQHKALVKEGATPQAVLEGLAKADLFHFAGHALITLTGVRLLLAGPEPGGFLDARDLEGVQRRHRRLAVLSSCYSAIGDEEKTSDSGFARSFFTAGFEEVLAARWRIDSTTTQSFMVTFYTAMLNGQPTAFALRDAVQAAMARPETSHPYYWAAFNLYVNH